MRKYFKMAITFLLLLCFCGCGNSKENNYITENDAKEVISNYLNALVESDMEKIKKYSTEKNQKNFNEDVLNVLKNDLKSMKLISFKIRDNKTKENEVLVDSEVEIICSDDFIATGDWMPGKTISTKTFELVKEDNTWKVNGYAVYP